MNSQAMLTLADSHALTINKPTAPYSTILCNKGQVASTKRLLDGDLVDVPKDIRSIERWVAPR